LAGKIAAWAAVVPMRNAAADMKVNNFRID